VRLSELLGGRCSCHVEGLPKVAPRVVDLRADRARGPERLPARPGVTWEVDVTQRARSDLVGLDDEVHEALIDALVKAGRLVVHLGSAAGR